MTVKVSVSVGTDYVEVEGYDAEEVLAQVHKLRQQLPERVSSPEPAEGRVVKGTVEGESVPRFNLTLIDYGRGFMVDSTETVQLDKFGEVSGPNGIWVLYCDGSVKYFPH